MGRLGHKKLIELEGAGDLERRVLEKWAYTIVRESESPRSNIVRFSCPICGGDAYERFTEIDDEDLGIWRIQWTSKCGHVSGRTEDVACVATPVEENDETVGVIEPVSPPPWPRYDGSGWKNEGKRLCACYGTLWQASVARSDENRLLAMIQSSDQ